MKVTRLDHIGIAVKSIAESLKVYEAMGRPAPTYVVLLRVDEIFSLKPGPTAGKAI